MKRILFSSFVVFLFVCGSVIFADPLTLIENAKPKSVIVIAEQAGVRSIEAQSAKILADHLFLITGGRLEVKRENTLGSMKVEKNILSFDSPTITADIKNFILVGESSATRELGISEEGLGPGGVRIKRFPNALAILGSTADSDKVGTRYAVIEFLSSLGVRYLWPGEVGRVIPKMPTVTVDSFDYSYTPIIGQRGMRWSRISEVESLQITLKEVQESRKKSFGTNLGVEWTAWHRLGGSAGVGGGHAGGGLTGGWEKHGATHPEWFALQADGTRDQSDAKGRWRLCKSNLQLIDYIAGDIIERVNKDPSITRVSLSPNDGGYSSHCMCENCKKLDPPDAPARKMTIFRKVGKSPRDIIDYRSLSDRMVWYWNQIATRVTKVHPNILFLGEAYSAWSTPPVREKLHSNLMIRYVPATMEGWEGWQKAGAKRIYWRPNILLSGRANGKLNIYVDDLCERMSFAADRAMLATDFDSIADFWAVHGLNYYATARLTWNPHLTVDQILDEYCSPGFGKAAGDIKEYILLVQKASKEENQEEAFTPQLLLSLRELLNKAEKTAGSDKAVLDRIYFLRMGLNFTDLQCTLDRMVKQASAKDPLLDRDRAQQLLELNYMALRDFTLHHYGTINSASLMRASGDFARRSPIKGRNYRPAKERIELAQGHSLTGKENSLDEMIDSLGLSLPEKNR